MPAEALAEAGIVPAKGRSAFRPEADGLWLMAGNNKKSDFMKYNEHYSYIIGCRLSNFLWKIVKRWDYLDQDTLGKQLIKSADAISSNIAEGWHRYYKKDKLLFYNYARSSFYEVIDHINKGITRGLISRHEAQVIKELLIQFPKPMNGLIKGAKDNLKK